MTRPLPALVFILCATLAVAQESSPPEGRELTQLEHLLGILPLDGSLGLHQAEARPRSQEARFKSQARVGSRPYADAGEYSGCPSNTKLKINIQKVTVQKKPNEGIFGWNVFGGLPDYYVQLERTGPPNYKLHEVENRKMPSTPVSKTASDGKIGTWHKHDGTLCVPDVMWQKKDSPPSITLNVWDEETTTSTFIGTVTVAKPDLGGWKGYTSPLEGEVLTGRSAEYQMDDSNGNYGGRIWFTVRKDTPKGIENVEKLKEEVQAAAEVEAQVEAEATEAKVGVALAGEDEIVGASQAAAAAEEELNKAEGVSSPQPFHFGCDVNPETGEKQLRARKDYSELTQPERKLYIEAVNAIKASGVYDNFVKVHALAQNKGYAHGTSGFLPWHRVYLWFYEEAIRAADGHKDGRFKCVTVPYWDWGQETASCAEDGGCKDFYSHSAILTDFGGPATDQNENRGNGVHGAPHRRSGDNGEQFWVGCVNNGPFKDWIDHNGHCLSRGNTGSWAPGSWGNLTGRARLLEIIGRNEEYGTGRGFRQFIEGAPHGMTHNYLGGHMRSFQSPADPIFFSHHAFVDKNWDMWQRCHGHTRSASGEQIDGARAFEEFAANKDKMYLATGRNNDGWEQKMPFVAPPDGMSQVSLDREKRDGPTGERKRKIEEATTKFCIKSIDPTVARGMTDDEKKDAEACKQCVHGQDSWCASNEWDEQCLGFCELEHCAEDCHMDFGTQPITDAIFPGWWTPEGSDGWQPMHVHNTQFMGSASENKGGYGYFPDEFDKKLAEVLKHVCQGHEIKARRRLGALETDAEAQKRAMMSLPHAEAFAAPGATTRDSFMRPQLQGSIGRNIRAAADRVVESYWRHLERSAVDEGLAGPKKRRLTETPAKEGVKRIAESFEKHKNTPDANDPNPLATVLKAVRKEECAILNPGGVTKETNQRFWRHWFTGSLTESEWQDLWKPDVPNGFHNPCVTKENRVKWDPNSKRWTFGGDTEDQYIGDMGTTVEASCVFKHATQWKKEVDANSTFRCSTTCKFDPAVGEGGACVDRTAANNAACQSKCKKSTGLWELMKQKLMAVTKMNLFSRLRSAMPSPPVQQPSPAPTPRPSSSSSRERDSIDAHVSRIRNANKNRGYL
jgi:hypothetical protein